MKRIHFLLILILMLVFTIVTASGEAKKAKQIINQPSVIIGGQLVKLEVADTPAKRTVGLMGRKSLAKNTGMLFVFDEPEKPVFWMKDCYISLDIVFLRNSKIVNMYQSVPPCKEDPCELYPSVSLVDKVLELPAGFTGKYNVKINDKVTFKGFRL